MHSSSLPFFFAFDSFFLPFLAVIINQAYFCRGLIFLLYIFVQSIYLPTQLIAYHAIQPSTYPRLRVVIGIGIPILHLGSV